MAKSAPEVLQVHVRSPYQDYFSGSAKSISAYNRLGLFDVLPEHAPIFSLLLPGVVTVVTLTETLRFKIQNGILKTKNNQVDVFLNI